jgi:tetratricopeptide (TPR) repeat protein
VLTESRVLVEYLYRIIIPQSGGGGLIHDDIVISTGLFSPVTTLISLCFHVGLLCFSWLARDKLRVFSFAVLWFYVGHLLESTFIALELYFEHRNYLPMIGPIFALVYYAVEWCVKVTAKGKFVICTAGILIIVISCLITKQASTIWGEPSVLFRVWANEHPNSPRANRIYGQLLGVEGEYQKAIVQLVQTNQKFPYDAGVLIDAMNIACKNDMQPPFTMLFLRQKILKAHYTDGLTYYVDRMFENVVDGSCSYVNEEVFFEIIDMLIELPRMTGPLSSKVLLLKAKFYIRNKKLNDAMSVLEQAYILYPNPILALLQSKLMLSAGIIEKATYYLDIADKSSQKNTFKNVALRAEIKAVKIQLENYRY